MSNSKDAVRKVLDAVKADKRTSLTAPEGKLVCDAYAIPVPKEGVAKSAAEAAKIASGMGFPVVMKIVSPDILHKTEAGGVVVGVKTAADAEKNYDIILANAKKYKADAKIEGIQIQQMLAGGTEVIVGSITDGSFGKLVAFGLGGVLVEVLKDITFRMAPAGGSPTHGEVVRSLSFSTLPSLTLVLATTTMVVRCCAAAKSRPPTTR